MPTLKIHREHTLGLPKARKVAAAWAAKVEHRFGMQCTVVRGQTSDTVEFTRSGVDGHLVVAPDHFDLDARLGVLLGVFSRTIESEIEKELDDLLDEGGQAQAGKAGGRAKAAAKPVAAAMPKPANRGGGRR